MRSVKWFLSSLTSGELNYVLIAGAFYIVCSILFKLAATKGPINKFLVGKLKISPIFLLKMTLAASLIFIISLVKAFIENNIIAMIVMTFLAIMAIYLIKKMDSFPINEIKEKK